MYEQPKQPVFFHGVACMTWSANRTYRVYARPGELFFIWAGAGGDSGALAQQGGLLGMLLASALDGEEKRKERMELLDRSRLEDVISDHKHNFRVQRTDLLSASLEPASNWLAVAYSQPEHAGVFRFEHREKGKFRLCLKTVQDMKTAMEHLPGALGGLLQLNFRWEGDKAVSL